MNFAKQFWVPSFFNSQDDQILIFLKSLKNIKIHLHLTFYFFRSFLKTFSEVIKTFQTKQKLKVVEDFCKAVTPAAEALHSFKLISKSDF